MNLTELLNKGVKTSLVCALSLMVSHTSLNADYLNSFYEPKSEKNSFDKNQHKKQISNKDYVKICEKLFEVHNFYFEFLLVEQDYFKNFEKNLKIQEKQRQRKLLKNLNQIITEAKKRIDNPNYESLKKQNEKVYYSSLALKHLLGLIMNDDFMQKTGGFDFLNAKIGILEYGKSVEKTKKYFIENDILKVFS